MLLGKNGSSAIRNSQPSPTLAGPRRCGRGSSGASATEGLHCEAGTRNSRRLSLGPPTAARHRRNRRLLLDCLRGTASDLGHKLCDGNSAEGDFIISLFSMKESTAQQPKSVVHPLLFSVQRRHPASRPRSLQAAIRLEAARGTPIITAAFDVAGGCGGGLCAARPGSHRRRRPRSLL